MAGRVGMSPKEGEGEGGLCCARRSARHKNVSAPSGFTDPGERFDVEGYLYHQGEALVRRFDANSYLYISRAMDLYDVSEGYPSLEAAFRRFLIKSLFIGIRPPFLFPSPH